MNEPVIPDWSVAAVRRQVIRFLGPACPAHDGSHLLRVEKMALRFADPACDPSVVSLIALLHDVDDRKLFRAIDDPRPNCRRILSSVAGLSESVADTVVGEVARIGYSKRLAGTVPATPEGKAVSDADMCDIMGATGIIRLVEYDVANGVSPFDPRDWPQIPVTHESYTASKTRGMVRHMFEKVLRLPDYMFTDAGRHEALTRKAANVAFLEVLFREQDAPEWNVLFDKLYDMPQEGE